MVVHRGLATASASFFVRLLSPLSLASATGRVRVRIGRNALRFPRRAGVVIVQRRAVGDTEKAKRLIERVQAHGARLIVDNDDAFDAAGSGEAPGPSIAALNLLIAEAEQLWVSSDGLADHYAGMARRIEVLPNSIDRRIWGDEPRPPPAPRRDAPIRILYMGTATHDRDLALVMPAFDRLHAEGRIRFELSLADAVTDPPKRPWLRVLDSGPTFLPYPRYVRWLQDQGPFDIGIAPLEDTAFNRCKSDIKFLDYVALGVLPILSDARPYAPLAPYGLVAVNTADGWFAALGQAAAEPGLRQGRLAAARAYVRDERGVERIAERQMALLGA